MVPGPSQTSVNEHQGAALTCGASKSRRSAVNRDDLDTVVVITDGATITSFTIARLVHRFSVGEASIAGHGSVYDLAVPARARGRRPHLGVQMHRRVTSENAGSRRTLWSQAGVDTEITGLAWEAPTSDSVRTLRVTAWRLQGIPVLRPGGSPPTPCTHLVDRTPLKIHPPVRQTRLAEFLREEPR